MKTLLSAVALVLLAQCVQAQVKTQPAPGGPKPIQPGLQPGGLQPGGGMQPGGMGGLYPFASGGQLALAANPEVQKDLKAKPEQVKKINDLAEQFKKTQMAAMQGGFGKDGMAGMKKLQEASEAATKSLGEILTADQSKRLGQLELQSKGPMALLDAKVTKDLSITNEQKLQVMKAYQTGMTKMSEIYKDMKLDPQQIQKQLADIQKKTTELNRTITADMVKTLTMEQQTKWKGMVGEAFKGELPQGGMGGMMGNPMMFPGPGGNPFGPGAAPVPVPDAPRPPNKTRN